MKKIFTLLVMVALAACWTSCSDDDNDDNTNWQEIKATLEITDATLASAFDCMEDEKDAYTTCKIIIDWGDGTIDESPKHYYSQKGIYYVTIKVKKIKKLNISYSQVTSLNLSEATELTTLWCLNCKLTSLDLSKNIKLTTLGCGNNKLTSLDLSRNIKLTELECYNNQLVSLDLSKNTELTKLISSSNQLSSLDLSKNIKLYSLDCSSNQLSSLDLTKNIELIELDCEENQFTQETVNALLTSLPMGKYNNGESISTLKINDKWDTSIAEEKGWKVN
ncbi:leucine-rich repeat domain-containing protein [Butyricimonas sp. RTP31003st1_G1_RTP31003_210430]|uniref:leucine-rich repeat domain-containing protein n=1 Tax=Butyricimonas sp. RTP31003st1_G1_RTP31003_210430 TaxID=3143210 RepID=UPI0034A11DC8